MNNEVRARRFYEILERMKRANTKEESLHGGCGIARETYEHVKGDVAGVQLSAPLWTYRGSVHDAGMTIVASMLSQKSPQRFCCSRETKCTLYISLFSL